MSDEERENNLTQQGKVQGLLQAIKDMAEANGISLVVFADYPDEELGGLAMITAGEKSILSKVAQVMEGARQASGGSTIKKTPMLSMN